MVSLSPSFYRFFFLSYMLAIFHTHNVGKDNFPPPSFCVVPERSPPILPLFFLVLKDWLIVLPGLRNPLQFEDYLSRGPTPIHCFLPGNQVLTQNQTLPVTFLRGLANSRQGFPFSHTQKFLSLSLFFLEPFQSPTALLSSPFPPSFGDLAGFWHHFY